MTVSPHTAGTPRADGGRTAQPGPSTVRPAAAPPIVDIRALTYTYPGAARPALERLDLEVRAGEALLVIGASGSGKSTLLRCLDGLVPHLHGGAISGRIRVAGRDPVAAAPRGMSELVGMVFQDPESQFVTRRVDDELAFAMENHGLPRRVMAERIETVLERLGIAHLRRRRVDTLSGGERQRVAIGSALTLGPPLLALDEPTSQLDPEAAGAVLELLGRLNREHGLTVILSEHRIERVAPWADRVLWLPGDGRPPVAGPPREVLAASELAPPLVRLARAVGWRPPPLTVEEAAPLAARLAGGSGRRDGAPGPGSSVSSSSTEPLIEARGLRYRYGGPSGAPALDGVDLAVGAGERVALVGANGAGKSTLLKLLVGLLRPEAGRVRVLGEAPAERGLAATARAVGLVPQNPGRLLFSDTVADEVRFTRRAQGLPEGDPAELLGRLGLAGLAGAYPGDLSGGERQRAALAAILAAEPRVLLLDEPTRGLDEPAKLRLAGLLAGLAAGGTAVVMATHDVELVARFAARTVVLADGRVAADGPTGEAMAAHPAFASQTLRLFGDPRVLTVEAALTRYGGAPEGEGGR